MMYLAYELLAHLKHLTLSGVNYYHELEWIGTEAQWSKVEHEIDLILNYEPS